MELISLNLPNPPNFSGFTNTGSTLAAPSAELVNALVGIPAAAGKVVTRITALRVAAVLASVKMLANDIAKMPLVLRQTTVANGRQRTQPALDNSLYTILKDVPNRWQTSFELRFFLATQLIMNGNCYCQKLTDQKGDIAELIPMDAWSTRMEWDHSGGPNPQRDRLTGKIIPVICWHYQAGDGSIQKFYQGDLWHVASHNFDNIGLSGFPMITLCKEAISVLMAAEETAGRNFANGLGMGGFISFPPDADVDEAQAQGVVDTLKKNFSGSPNAGKFTVIPYGGKWEKMTFNAQESQLLESRKFNEEEIARAFGGAPLVVKLGLGQQNSTYASSSAFLDEYFNTSLLPYTTAIEQSITRDLIDKADRTKLYAKHNPDVILRGGPAERAKEYKDRITSTQMTPNEARVLEDRDTIPGGDVLIASANSCIFDIDKQEWFIPGQLVPESDGTADENAPGDEQEPDAQGGDENNDEQDQKPTKKPVKKAAKKPTAQSTVVVDKLNRLVTIANSLAERVMRKEAKGGIDAKFVAEVMNVSKEQADAYIAGRSKMNDQEARTALVSLAQGE